MPDLKIMSCCRNAYPLYLKELNPTQTIKKSITSKTVMKIYNMGIEVNSGIKKKAVQIPAAIKTTVIMLSLSLIHIYREKKI